MSRKLFRELAIQFSDCLPLARSIPLDLLGPCYLLLSRNLHNIRKSNGITLSNGIALINILRENSEIKLSGEK